MSNETKQTDTKAHVLKQRPFILGLGLDAFNIDIACTENGKGNTVYELAGVTGKAVRLKYNHRIATPVGAWHLI